MAFDAAAKRVYVTCGSGVISTVEQLNADQYRELPDIATPENTRNAQFISSLKKLYVAIPPHEGRPAEFRVSGSRLDIGR